MRFAGIIWTHFAESFNFQAPLTQVMEVKDSWQRYSEGRDCGSSIFKHVMTAYRPGECCEVMARRASSIRITTNCTSVSLVQVSTFCDLIRLDLTYSGKRAKKRVRYKPQILAHKYLTQYEDIIADECRLKPVGKERKASRFIFLGRP